MNARRVAILFFVAACEGASTSAPEVPDGAIPPEDAGADVLSPGPDVVDAGPTFDAALPETLLTLSQTGLYDDIAQKTLSPWAREFSPTHVLWSDGAEKRRWVVVPPGTSIDTSDMDHWRFPVGTRFFKEFVRDGKRLETRLVYRRADTQNAEKDYFLGAFAWRDDESDADFVKDGKTNVRGTDHDVPAQIRCTTCHVGEVGRVLGFSALQLARDGAGITLGSLAAEGRLSHPPPAGADYRAPGSPSTAAALGYLHANCGHCHNPSGSAWPDAQMVLRLDVGDRDPSKTKLAETTIGVALTRWKKPPFTLRVAPGDPAASGLLERMTIRGSLDQMPPIATKHVDPAGAAAVTAWIESL